LSEQLGAEAYDASSQGSDAGLVRATTGVIDGRPRPTAARRVVL